MFHVKHSYHFSHDYLSKTWPLPAQPEPVAALRDFWIFGGFPPFLTRYEKGPDDGPRPAYHVPPPGIHAPCNSPGIYSPGIHAP